MIIVEDGSNVTGANSYVTESELNTWLTDRGLSITGSASVNLLLAMDYLETQRFIGVKSNTDQELQWPRTGVYIDSMAVGADEIPKDLKLAQIQTAYSIDQGANPMDISTPAVKREKVDSLEVEYQDGAGRAVNVAINRYLSKLLISSGSTVQVNIIV